MVIQKVFFNTHLIKVPATIKNFRLSKILTKKKLNYCLYDNKRNILQVKGKVFSAFLSFSFWTTFFRPVRGEFSLPRFFIAVAWSHTKVLDVSPQIEKHAHLV